jgi:hypothetical protein
MGSRKSNAIRSLHDGQQGGEDIRHERAAKKLVFNPHGLIKT